MTLATLGALGGQGGVGGVTFMGFWVLVEEEERHSILQESITQQLKALVGDVLLACLGSEGLQQKHYVRLPARTHRHTGCSFLLISNM